MKFKTLLITVLMIAYSLPQAQVSKDEFDKSKEIESSKNTFNSKCSNHGVITFLTETTFFDKKEYQKNSAFADKRKGKPEFEEYKSNLKNDPDQILVDTPTQKESRAKSSLERRVSVLEQNQRNINNDKEWFDGITFQVDIFSILISLILNVVILLIVKRKLLKEARSYTNWKIREATSNNSNSDETRFQKKIEHLEQEIKTIKDKINEINTSIQLAYTPPKTEKLDTEISEPRQEIFYLSTPNLDGSFNHSSASTNYREGASIYRFTKTSSNSAQFQIDEREASIALALQYPDKNIDPVCDAENAFNPKPKTIITTKPGEAELVGDKWIKKNKAKIRYEN